VLSPKLTDVQQITGAKVWACLHPKICHHLNHSNRTVVCSVRVC